MSAIAACRHELERVILVVRVLLFVILLSDMEMISNFTLKKLRKSISTLMWSGKGEIFRWITERSFSLILSLVMSFVL